MKILYTGDILSQLKSSPELCSDRRISLLLKMICMESAVEQYLAGNTDVAKKLLSQSKENVIPLSVCGCGMSSSLGLLLAYCILRYFDPDKTYTFFYGTYELEGKNMKICFIEIQSKSEEVFVTLFTEDDLSQGNLLLGDKKCKNIVDILSCDPDYCYESSPLPGTIGGIMKWLRGMKIVNDTNVPEIVSYLEDLLSPGKDFVGGDLFFDPSSQEYEILLRSILKCKISKGISLLEKM